MPYKYYLNEPFLKGNEKEYVLDVLNSGWLSINGKHTKIFEQKFAELMGVNNALAVQSGTSALHTSLLALGVGKGDKVVVPNYTCAASVTTVLQCGAKPLIVDIEPDTFGINPEILKELVIKEKPRVISQVHVYGFPAKGLEEIINLCREEKISLLEDCCEAHGAEYKSKKVGSFGEISAFSLRSEKMMGVGEGGMVITDDKKLIESATYWATRASPFRGDQQPYWYNYFYSGVGFNYRMPHILGAIGRGQIENFPEILRRKVAVGKKYRELLGGMEGIQLQGEAPDSSPVYWLNFVKLKDKSTDSVHKIGERLMREGVEVRPPFWPLGNQKVFEEFAYGSQAVGNSLFAHGLILPSSVFLADNNCKGVEEVVDLFLECKKSID